MEAMPAGSYKTFIKLFLNTGSEWGEEGTKSPDNDYALRPCFDAPKPNDLTDLIRRLIALRRESDALCSGSYRNIVITNHQLIFERKTEKENSLLPSTHPTVNSQPDTMS